MPNFYLGEITQAIMDEYFAAFYKLDGRASLSESELTNAMAIALRQRGLFVQEQICIQNTYLGRKIGNDFIDILVNESVVIKLKNLLHLRRGNIGQLRDYLQAGNYPVGMLLNFGGHQAELKQLENRNAFPPDWRGE